MRRLLLVDDHEVVRQGLQQILQGEMHDLEVGHAGGGHEALRLTREEPWDLVVLDISLPDLGGFEVLRALRSARPRLPVLVLSMYPEEQFAIRALRGGAVGYVTKRTAAGELVTAVRKALNGGRYVSPGLAEHLRGETVAVGRAPHELLSDREFQVFRLLGGGKPVTAVAAELQLAVQTVSTYRARILQKMGLRENSDLIRYALVHNLID